MPVTRCRQCRHRFTEEEEKTFTTKYKMRGILRGFPESTGTLTLRKARFTKEEEKISPQSIEGRKETWGSPCGSVWLGAGVGNSRVETYYLFSSVHFFKTANNRTRMARIQLIFTDETYRVLRKYPNRDLVFARENTPTGSLIYARSSKTICAAPHHPL